MNCAILDDGFAGFVSDLLKFNMSLGATNYSGNMPHFIAGFVSKSVLEASANGPDSPEAVRAFENLKRIVSDHIALYENITDREEMDSSPWINGFYETMYVYVGSEYVDAAITDSGKLDVMKKIMKRYEAHSERFYQEVISGIHQEMNAKIKKCVLDKTYLDVSPEGIFDLPGFANLLIPNSVKPRIPEN